MYVADSEVEKRDFVTKPHNFRETYLINEDTAYSGADHLSGGDGQLSQGWLHRGRVVWLEKDLPSGEKNTAVPVYAEGLGVIQLHAGCLDRARLLRARA
jgi:hypothetical protein